LTDIIRVVADALYIYPVKSCAPVRVEALNFDEEGLLVGDREWVVVDECASVVWQGSHPRLALVHPEFHADKLALRNSRGDCVQFDRAAMRVLRDVSIWNDVAKRNDFFAASDAGNEVAAFLENTVGARLRLMRLGYEGQRREGSRRVHIVSRSSFEDLATDLPRTAQPPENLMRFRPNIVITGESEPLVPFIEEQVTKLQWSANPTAALEVGERSTRCVVPNVDPATASDDARVLEVVHKSSTARYPGEPISFGVYATSIGASTLHRGASLKATLTD
jgi:uncharacterized protein